jgi:hypothetical protein
VPEEMVEVKLRHGRVRVGTTRPTGHFGCSWPAFQR